MIYIWFITQTTVTWPHLYLHLFTVLVNVARARLGKIAYIATDMTADTKAAWSMYHTILSRYDDDLLCGGGRAPHIFVHCGGHKLQLNSPVNNVQGDIIHSDTDEHSVLVSREWLSLPVTLQSFHPMVCHKVQQPGTSSTSLTCSTKYSRHWYVHDN